MKKRQVTYYALEFRVSSAKLASESEQSISQTARELGIHPTTLHGWVRKYHPHSKHEASNINEDVHSELKRLKKELARTKQERDILKKAAAYFASEAQ